MSAADVARAIMMRWRLVLLAAIVAGVAGLALAMAAPRMVVATTTLMVDQPSEIDPAATRGGASVDMDQVLGEQADLVRSERVVGAAANDPMLAAQPALRAAWQKATHAQTPFHSWIAQTIGAHLSVDHEHASNLLVVKVTDADPKAAAALANATARAYLATQVKIASDPSRTYADWYRARIGEARGSLERAQVKLVDFQRSHDLVATPTADGPSERLQGLTQQLTLAYGTRSEINARLASDPDAAAGAQNSRVSQDLQSAIAQQGAKVAELGKRLGPLHPEMIAASATLARLRDEAKAARTAVARSQAIESSGADRRVVALERLVSAERGRILAAQANRAQLDLLQRDVVSASANYDAVQARLMGMRLRAEAPRTNVRQLDVATPPASAGRAQLAIRTVLALILGIALGITIALGLEWRDPRVRSNASMVQLVSAPVLVTLPLSAYATLPGSHRRAA